MLKKAGKTENLSQGWVNLENQGRNSITCPNKNPGVCIRQLRVITMRHLLLAIYVSGSQAQSKVRLGAELDQSQSLSLAQLSHSLHLDYKDLLCTGTFKVDYAPPTFCMWHRQLAVVAQHNSNQQAWLKMYFCPQHLSQAHRPNQKLYT